MVEVGQRLSGEIVAVGTFNEGFFRIKDNSGYTYTCYVRNRDKWDVLYDWMSRDRVSVLVNDKIRDDILVVSI